MPIIDPDQGVPLPAGTDLADNPVAFSNFYTPVMSRLILRYVDAADRAARHPAPVLNETSILDNATWYDRWTGSKWIPVTKIAIAKTINQIVNNSTVLVNDNALVLPLPAANTRYEVSALILYMSSQAGDIKFGFTTPAGATVVIGGPGMNTAAAGQTATSDWEVVTSPSTRPYGGAGGATTSMTKVRATVLTAAATGTIQLQWAQNVADPSNTTVFLGSLMTVEAIQ